MSRYSTIGLCVVCCALASAKADSIMHVASIPLQTTNWNNPVNIPKFDSSLGILTKIMFKLDGGVQGISRFESRDASPTTVTTKLSATVSLKRPDLTDLVIATPTAMTVDMVTAYDGVDDFGGTSGRTHSGLSANDLQSSTLMAPFSPVDMANFIGGPMSMVSLPVTAVGTSSGSGAGNLLLIFNTQAAAGIMVTYEYNVPEPATWFGFLVVLSAVVQRRTGRAVGNRG